MDNPCFIVRYWSLYGCLLSVMVWVELAVIISMHIVSSINILL